MTRPAAVAAIAEAAEGAAAVSAAGAGGGGGGGEQLALLPPTQFGEGARRHRELAERVRRDRAGRPPGARNLATRDVVEYVRKVFGDPMVESARWLGHTPQTLAAELGCTALEAFELLEGIRRDLRRFMYAPLAAVDGQGNVVPPSFTMVVGGAAQGADGRPPWVYAGGPVVEQETQQNQALPAPAPEPSHAGSSHDGK